MPEVRDVADRDEWNAIVQSFPLCDVRQSHEWGEIRRHEGWRPHRLAFYEDGRPRVALSALARPLPGVGSVLYAPRGPLLDPDDPGAWRALPELISAIARATNAIFLRLSPGLADHDPHVARLRETGGRPVEEFWATWNTYRNPMVLDLRGTERDLLARMTKKRRQRITRAAATGVSVEIATDAGAARAFYALLVDHAAHHGYPVRGAAYYERLREQFAGRGAVAIVLGRLGGELQAAQLGIRFGGTAYALHLPSTPAARLTHAGDAVEWEWIRWARATGCTSIEFGSSGTYVPPRGTEITYGSYLHKTELGCVLRLCAPYHDYVFAPRRYRLVRAAEAAVLPRVRSLLSRGRWVRIRARCPAPR